MRLPVEPAKGLVLRFTLTLAVAGALAGCASSGSADLADQESAPGGLATASGPAADYPVVVGDPYRVGSETYTPNDTMNYDEVGYIAPTSSPGAGITGAHHTLPLPSYVEVTSLDTGRTILVRLEQRGPMQSNDLVSLSSSALAQLQATSGTPVRVRRVNPPEDQRALLRMGQQAPLRMDTPETLLTVLKRKLPEAGSVSLARKGPNAAPAIASVDPGKSSVPEAPKVAELPPIQRSEPDPEPVRVASLPEEPQPPRSAPPALPQLEPRGAAVPISVAPAPAERPVRAAQVEDDAFIVQAATFSTRDRAQKVANVLGGEVNQSGQYYLVRTGPFPTRGQAEASLAKVKAAGYRDARIFTNG